MERWPDGKGSYTRYWWVTFAATRNRTTAACYEGEADDVERRASGDGEVRTIRPLPYPADPRVPPAYPTAADPCPSFCYSPAECQGRTACPKSYACSE